MFHFPVHLLTYPLGYTNVISNAASLESYKYLLETQTTLQATVDNVNAIGGNAKIRQAVLSTILPIIQNIESTIDKMGDDFSVQKFDPAEYVFFLMRLRRDFGGTDGLLFLFLSSLPSNSQDNLLLLVNNSADAIDTLGTLNASFASSTAAAIKNVQASFKGLSDSVKAAAAIPIGPFPAGAPVTCTA